MIRNVFSDPNQIRHLRAVADAKAAGGAHGHTGEGANESGRPGEHL